MEDNIILEDYYTNKPIKYVSRNTLIKKLQILEPKFCKICKCRLKFNSSTWNTSTYCTKCVKQVKINNAKKTIQEKYWVKNISQLKSNQEKIKQNNLNKYWVTNTTKLDSVQNKMKKTNLKKYWVEYPQKLEQFKEKIEQTNLEKYWVKHILQKDTTRQRLKQYEGQQILNKNKNVIQIKDWYWYKCEICWETTHYIWKDKTNFLQRLNLWFLPCHKCIPKEQAWCNTRSSYELRIEKLFNDIWIKTKHQIELDILFTDYNLAVEINWIYWHSEKFKDKNYHKNKILKFKEKWIQILWFTDRQLDNDYEKIINYIKWKLNLLPSIWASKCKIREISTYQAKNFCEKHHIHWYAWWKTKYWLFHKEELLSVCVVWKNRFSKDWSLEIIRLANKQKVIWWMWRFMKRILKDFPTYKKITTFIDVNLWLADKNVFTYNWFNFVSHTKPNYEWIYKNKVLSRQQTQKHKLLKQWFVWDSEVSIMKWLWAYRLYNAWNYKYEYNKKD